MNSNLNLQLTGELSDNVFLEGSISDNNIPIQPEGNSQQLQDFDKVFIKLYNKQNSAIFGDYEIEPFGNSYLKYHKKSQGVMAITEYNYKGRDIKNEAAFAVSKGRTCRKTFQGIEGNQGPYKLTGNDNELFIIVLSGTEKVYINGQLMKRGDDYDYTIDYNSAEITFTPYKLITKDSRITVDFEYSDKYYARFMLISNNVIESRKSKTTINYISEQDNKNQSLQQNLNSERIKILEAAGNNTAYVESSILDSSKNENKIYYIKTDTNIHGTIFKNIYVLSQSSSNNVYSVTFSYVGANKGYYKQFKSNANGKTYQWIAPNDLGILQGDYMPISVLIAPKKKQMFVIENEYKISKNSNSHIALSFSDNDANTFSSIGDSLNKGFALQTGLDHWFRSDSNLRSLKISLNQEIISKSFDGFDNFKPVEFNRNWNLWNDKKTSEWHTTLSLDGKSKNREFAYKTELLVLPDFYSGTNQTVTGHFAKNGYSIHLSGNSLLSSDTLLKTFFNRYNFLISKEIKTIRIGLGTNQEYNKKVEDNKKLSLLSERNFSHKIFIEKPDSTNWVWNISTETRNDYLPDTTTNNFKKQYKSYDFNALVGLNQNPNNIFRVLCNYRILNPENSSINKPEKNLLGRIEHHFAVFKKAITSSMFYQIGSGLETKKTYVFIEVTSGQGIYMWNESTDYNKNEKAEINEFEIAKYKYQANYIKMYIPSNEYISTFSNQFNELLIITPQQILGQRKIEKLFARFSNTTNYKCSFKTLDNSFLNNMLPRSNSKRDTSLTSISNYFSNTLYFNRNRSKFNFYYNFLNETNRYLNSNGWEQTSTIKHSLNSRIDVFQTITFNTIIEKGNNSSKLEASFMENKNYEINFQNIEPKIIWQPSVDFSINFSSKISQKKDQSGITSQSRTFSSEWNINNNKTGKITMRGDYIFIKYNSETNSSLAYTMLEGLLPGKNFTWELTIQNDLGKNLHLGIEYQGQKSEDTKIIHTGSIQLSAYF